MDKADLQKSQIIREYIQGSLCREVTEMIIHTKKVAELQGEKPYHRGYYTGAFDMFHYGHLLGIQNALNYCDQLIVAVSTDEVIRDYKHREPVIPFEQRLAIVSAIKGVSIAIPQYDLYNKMGPANMLGCDVIFSSDEYQRESYENGKMTAKQQAGVERWEKFEEEASEQGIDVVYLPRTEGISSSDIKGKIVEQFMQRKEESAETTLQADEEIEPQELQGEGTTLTETDRNQIKPEGINSAFSQSSVVDNSTMTNAILNIQPPIEDVGQ